MKRVLLLDTNRAAHPILLALRRKGFDVWVAGRDPEDFLARLVANYIQLDYSNIVQVEAILRKYSFDYLVPGCNDLSYMVCSEVGGAKFRGLDSPETSQALLQKDQFRRFATSIGLPAPRVFGIDCSDVGCPVIVKPVDSYSGRGMTVVRDWKGIQLSLAIEAAQAESRSRSAIVEEFVEGQLISHSAFISRQRIVADFVVQEDCTVNPFTVDASRLYPNFPAELLVSIRNDIRCLSRALNLVDGLVHSQLIVKEGKYWFIEVTRRCPGDLYSLLIEQSTGYDYAASYAAPFVAGQLESPPPAEQLSRVIRHTLSSTDPQNLSGFTFNRPVTTRMLIPLASPGDIIRQAPFGRAGIVFLEADSGHEWDELYQAVMRHEVLTFHS